MLFWASERSFSPAGARKCGWTASKAVFRRLRVSRLLSEAMNSGNRARGLAERLRTRRDTQDLSDEGNSPRRLWLRCRASSFVQAESSAGIRRRRLKPARSSRRLPVESHAEGSVSSPFPATLRISAAFFGTPHPIAELRQYTSRRGQSRRRSRRNAPLKFRPILWIPDPAALQFSTNDEIAICP